MRPGNKGTKLIAKFVWSTEFMNRLSRDNSRSLARDELKLVFSIRDMLKKMDTYSSCLKFSSLELLHEVEN